MLLETAVVVPAAFCVLAAAVLMAPTKPTTSSTPAAPAAISTIPCWIRKGVRGYSATRQIFRVGAETVGALLSVDVVEDAVVAGFTI